MLLVNIILVRFDDDLLRALVVFDGIVPSPPAAAAFDVADVDLLAAASPASLLIIFASLSPLLVASVGEDDLPTLIISCYIRW